jgi:hypothetical protein
LSRLCCAALVGAAVVLLASPAWSQAPPDAEPAGPPPEIVRLAGELYRVNAGAQVTVFLVTPDGVIVADPLDRATARALAAELTRRFPEQPVRYVVHTGPRVDRAEGSGAFTRSAEVVAHASFSDQVSSARRGDSGPFLDLDRNGNGVFEVAELGSDDRSAFVRSHDSDGDRRITAGELYRYVIDAESRYEVSRTLMLGGSEVRLAPLPSGESGSSTAVLFPRERQVFVDTYPGLSGPLASAGMPPRSVLEWFQDVAALDFDTLLAGDGAMATRDEVAIRARYLGDLYALADAAYAAGRPPAAAPATVLDAYRGASFYGQRQAHLEEVSRALGARRLSLQIAPTINALTTSTLYCASYAECGRDFLVAGATAAAALTVRRAVVTAEVSLERQAIASRTSALYDDAWAHRETTLSVLAGYGGPWARSWTRNFLAGMSYTRLDSDGVSRVKQAFFPTGGLRPRHAESWRLGITGGADLMMPFAARYAFVVPVRVTYAVTGQTNDLQPGRLSVRAGFGVRADLHRSN